MTKLLWNRIWNQQHIYEIHIHSIFIWKNFRSYNTVINYNNEETDYDCTEFLNYFQFIWPLKTTSDGNCLFHATSISIYRNESESWNLKLCSAFIFYENQEFFIQVLQSDGNQATIPMLINKILKLNKWQDRLTIVALNI